MEQVLQLHTTYGQTSMHNEQGQFERVAGYGEHQATLDLQTIDGGGLQIEKTPLEMDINMDEVFESISPSVLTKTLQMPEEGRQAALEATARYAELGRMFLNPDADGITAQSQDVSLEGAREIYGLTWMPSVQAETTFKPEELHFSYERDKVTLDVQEGINEFDYVAGGHSTELAVKGNVDVQYVGSFHYFPTGKYVDTRA